MPKVKEFGLDASFLDASIDKDAELGFYPVPRRSQIAALVKPRYMLETLCISYYEF